LNQGSEAPDNAISDELRDLHNLPRTRSVLFNQG
jgi:hypothetical protein